MLQSLSLAAVVWFATMQLVLYIQCNTCNVQSIVHLPTPLSSLLLPEAVASTVAQLRRIRFKIMSGSVRCNALMQRC